MCGNCHKLAHGAVNIREMFKPENTGRPRKQPPENYKDILWDYVYGKIGRKECERLLGLGDATKIYDMWFYKDFVKENNIDIAVLTIPKNGAIKVAEKLVECNIKAIWNFAHVDLNLEGKNVVVENVHLSDSLMQLSYNIVKNQG